jgi:hypothetical protein
MNKDVLDYIRANRSTYTREAIDTKLREEGHTDTDIEAAWKTIHDEDVLAEQAAQAGAKEAASRPQQASHSSFNGGCLYAALLVIGVILLLLIDVGFYLLRSLSYSGSPDVTPLLLFVNLGSLVVLGALAGVASLLKRRGWSGGQVAGLVAAVAVVWYIVLGGTCIYGPGIVQ